MTAPEGLQGGFLSFCITAQEWLCSQPRAGNVGTGARSKKFYVHTRHHLALSHLQLRHIPRCWHLVSQPRTTRSSDGQIPLDDDQSPGVGVDETQQLSWSK